MDALLDDDKKKQIVDELDGVGKKVADHWAEVIEESGSHPYRGQGRQDRGRRRPRPRWSRRANTSQRASPSSTTRRRHCCSSARRSTPAAPEFLRQEWFRYQKLEGKWRKPRGMHSKMRRHYGYRPPIVSIGYRGPAEVRGLHPSGFKEVMVFNVSQLNGIDPKVQAVRIGGTVGARKRGDIIAKADQEGIRVLNR